MNNSNIENISGKYDAIVVGAGMAGMYMLKKLRDQGFTVRVYEKGSNIGGVWYWNRYPGARCDTESIIYCYMFSEELYHEWNWSSRFPEQWEILNYLNYVADKFDLRRDIQFNTNVTCAKFDERNNQWIVQTDDGQTVSAKYFITAVGNLSAANVPNIKGLDVFEGEWYHTGNWPHEKVDFKGKRVGVIGTGSSGIQAIPVIAKEAEQLYVFQRTPQYSTPARNHPLDPEFIEETKKNFKELRDYIRNSSHGFLIEHFRESAKLDSEEERLKLFEEAWKNGSNYLQFTYKDIVRDKESNKMVADFVRQKIRETVKDPEVAKKLMPTYYFATKRPVRDTDYFATYNRDNVQLVDIKEHPIVEITLKGIKTTKEEYALDTIVFATGYDAVTGSLLKIDIRGKDGMSLKEKWEDGANVKTYLGLMTKGFPNMFMITGPESPSIFINMAVAIEQHVEWISDCIDYIEKNNYSLIEAEEEAEIKWSQHCRKLAEETLYLETDSFYTGANIDGKPRSFPLYLGGNREYRKICNEVAEKNYQGFNFIHSSEIVKKY